MWTFITQQSRECEHQDFMWIYQSKRWKRLPNRLFRDKQKMTDQAKSHWACQWRLSHVLPRQCECKEWPCYWVKLLIKQTPLSCLIYFLSSILLTCLAHRLDQGTDSHGRMLILYLGSHFWGCMFWGYFTEDKMALLAQRVDDSENLQNPWLFERERGSRHYKFLTLLLKGLLFHLHCLIHIRSTWITYF